MKNTDSYTLDIERMNGTDLHTLELKEDDVLRIRFETVRGSLYMEIKALDGTVLYSGNGKETTDFTVNIPESGAYTLTPLEEKIRLSFGIECPSEDSLETIMNETAAISVERVEQIRAKALRKLRHPRRARILKNSDKHDQ